MEAFRPTGLLRVEESKVSDPASTMQDSFVPNGLLGGLSAPDTPQHSLSTTTISKNRLSNLASVETGASHCTISFVTPDFYHVTGRSFTPRGDLLSQSQGET